MTQINVKDFGAVGDGKTDDTAAIQKAIDAAVTQNASLIIPAGRYVVKPRSTRSKTLP